MILTIVGGGATSLSFLYNYLSLSSQQDLPATTIYLIEKRGLFGPGVAYAPDVQSNILNSKTGFITPFHDKPGDFFNWLVENQWTWRRSYPHFSLQQDSYAPRSLFGMYLKNKMAWLVKQALIKNVRIVQIDAEAKDITENGASYITKTDCGLSLTSDYVFLCCGTLPGKQPDHAAGVNRILDCPYPIDELKNKIPNDAPVGIIGARLSCIDAVIGLIENGHNGGITVYSRSGYFPSVRGTQGRSTLKLLTASNIDAWVRLNGKFTLHDIVQLVMQEISLLSGVVQPEIALPPAPPADLETYLKQEIELAQESRAWQAVLYSTNAVIDKLWSALDDSEKEKFLSKYFSAFMSYRVSIPEENARKILSYLESGKLFFRGGAFTVSIDVNGKPLVNSNTGGESTPVAYDFLINATGSPRGVKELNSDLLANVLERGLAIPHKFGGIAVNSETYQLIDKSGRNSYIYAIGELTTGTFFFTSALEINARHARNCAMKFIGSVHQRREKPHEPKLLRIKQGRHSRLSLNHLGAGRLLTHRRTRITRRYSRLSLKHVAALFTILTDHLQLRSKKTRSSCPVCRVPLTGGSEPEPRIAQFDKQQGN